MINQNRRTNRCGGFFINLNKSRIYEAILFGKVAGIEAVPDAALLIEVSRCNAEELAAYVVVRT